MSYDIAEAKRRLPLPDLLHRLGLAEHATKSARCPFHDDKHNSFSVWKNADGLWFWKCHASCGEGDEITFLEKHKGITNSDAIREFLSITGVSGKKTPRLKVLEPSEQTFNWGSCVDDFTDKNVEQIAKWRGYSVEFVKQLRDKGQIGVYKGLVAFPVHNDGKIVGTHVRKKDGKWFYAPEGIKAAPLVFGELIPGKPVNVFESTWDGLDYLDKTGERDGIIITRGASNGKLVAGLIPPGSPVYAWKQNDELDKKTGKRPADEWLKHVMAHANAKVLGVKTPAEFKDLNAWTLLRSKAGATKEELREELCAAVKNAEVICEAPTPYPSRNAQAAGDFQAEIKIADAGLDSGGRSADDETLSRLAAMAPLEYESKRKAEAKRLRCRESVLDKLVEAKRPSKPGNDTLQGQAVRLPNVEPWPEAVNGADVLEAISERIGRYVVMPPAAADVCALWCAHTHCFKSFQKSPRLNISAPTEECGKSTLRNCVSLFCARAKRTDNMTTAVMFRLVSGHSATILADECDKWLFTNEELLGLVQSGHEKGGTVMRCEGDSNELREFGCYAPFVLAAIGTLPSQLHGRSIRVRLERARIKEMEERSVFDFEHVEHETELNRKLARFISDNRERIQSCDPKLPAHLFNRIADNWRPLFKIAEAAGGNWPKRCADVLVNLTTREDERENLRVMLLTDIKQVFTLERMFSKDLVEHLTELKERPWPEVCHGKPITQNWLARNLAPFDIRPKNVRVDDVQAKGYEVEDFKDAFERYIPSSPGAGVFHPSHRPNARENAQNASVPKNNVGTDEKDASYIGEWDGGTAKKGGVGPNEHINTDSGGQSGQKPTPATPPEQPKSQPKAAASTASVPVPPAVSPIVGDEFGVGRL